MGKVRTVNLPSHDEARVEQSKVVDYLLSPDHSEGAGKAAFFTRFGFAREAWTVLANALLAHAGNHPVAAKSITHYGTKFQVDGTLVCPDGRTASIRTVWIIEVGTSAPILVAAHPI